MYIVYTLHLQVSFDMNKSLLAHFASLKMAGRESVGCIYQYGVERSLNTYLSLFLTLHSPVWQGDYTYVTYTNCCSYVEAYVCFFT